MKENKKRKASKIIERIANANGVSPKEMRSQVNAALENMIQDKSKPHGFILSGSFSDDRQTTDEFVVAFEQELYNALMPQYAGWEWDGVGYRNISLLGRKKRNLQ